MGSISTWTRIALFVIYLNRILLISNLFSLDKNTLLLTNLFKPHRTVLSRLYLMLEDKAVINRVETV